MNEKNKQVKQPQQPQKIDFTYSQNIVPFLDRINSTILLTTYQTNKVMIIGQEKGEFDIRFKDFPRPMGMCKKDGKIFAGLGYGIYQFSNFTGVAGNLEEGNRYDACYMPQNIHFTADIDIHEMEYCQDELYFINTKFSCLCIKEPNSSFKPIWKPPFITLLQPVDKCHLNGFCTRDGEPRYVTMLGNTDEPLGWRANKANGGMLMDIKTNEILIDGLSMPHSPRWHQEKLYLLESGKGAISYYDFETKKTVEIAKVPGFTRGLDIVGDFAFIGVSKVRESATFSGLEITKLPKRVSGVWIVNIKTGQIISFVEFTAGLDEVFAITVLPHRKLEMFDFNTEQSKVNYMISPDDLEQVKMPETKLEMAAPHFEKGTDLFNENKKEEAIEHFKKALEIQSDYLPATFNLAICLGDLERYDEAEKLLQKVIENDASILGSYDSLGYVYYKKGDFKRAEEQYKKIIELDPENAKAKNSLEVLKEKKTKMFELKFVYNYLTSEEKSKIVDLWTSCKVVSKEEALKRVDQVSVIILNEKEIVGVSTVYINDFTAPDNPYFFYRMFIKEEFRRSYILKDKVVLLNFFELKKIYGDKVNGLVIELENSKFANLGKNTKYFIKKGFTYYGKSPRGLQLWYVRYDDPKGKFKVKV